MSRQKSNSNVGRRHLLPGKAGMNKICLTLNPMVHCTGTRTTCWKKSCYAVCECDQAYINGSVSSSIFLSDFLPIKLLVEAQLLKMQTHRQNKENEASYRQRRADVEQYYNRLRSAGTVLPSLYEFRKLSVMTTMQGSVTGSRPNSSGLAKDMKNSALVAELVAADLKTWMASAREKLSELLGFPKWRSASKTKLHPLDRITARFRCQGCRKVAKRYEKEQCLDFAGVCAHECPSDDKKTKKPVDWSVDRFIKDEKVCCLIYLRKNSAQVYGPPMSHYAHRRQMQLHASWRSSISLTRMPRHVIPSRCLAHAFGVFPASMHSSSWTSPPSSVTLCFHLIYWRRLTPTTRRLVTRTGMITCRWLYCPKEKAQSMPLRRVYLRNFWIRVSSHRN